MSSSGGGGGAAAAGAAGVTSLQQHVVLLVVIIQLVLATTISSSSNISSLVLDWSRVWSPLTMTLPLRDGDDAPCSESGKAPYRSTTGKGGASDDPLPLPLLFVLQLFPLV